MQSYFEYPRENENSSNTKIKIYGGNKIGGCVTVISYKDQEKTWRIMIDYGENLRGSNHEDFSYPWDDEPVDAVFFSHYHGDHIGRILEIPEDIPLYMGEFTRQVMENTYRALSLTNKNNIQYKKALDLFTKSNRLKTFSLSGKTYSPIKDIPTFTIRPFFVDHSAYDAFMFLIESPDKTVLYTGDFRDHGRLGKGILPTVNTYLKERGRRDVDILITEGTMLTRLESKVLSEFEMQARLEELFSKHRHCFVLCSTTNFDSLTSFIKAGEAKGLRAYTYSKYLQIQLRSFSAQAGLYSNAFKFRDIYTLDLDRKLKSKYWSEPKSQEDLLREKGFVAFIKGKAYCEKFIDPFLDLKPIIIYSMWKGYLDPTKVAYNSDLAAFIKRQEAKGIEVIYLHTGGHASPDFLAKFMNEVDPREAIIPIHSEDGKKIFDLDIRDELKGLVKYE